MQQTEIGEFSVSIDGDEFNFSPTLRNIAKIADAESILRVYDAIHSPFTALWYRVSLAYDVLYSCCDRKEIKKYLVKTRNLKPHFNQHSISINDQINVAAALLRHGVSGVNAPDYEGSKKARGKSPTEFNVYKVASEAMTHWKMSESDAMNLTMTKFRYLLAAKFPSEAVKNRENAPSMDAHKAIMKAAYEANERKKAAKEATK